MQPQGITSPAFEIGSTVSRWLKFASCAVLLCGAGCGDGLFVLPSQATPPPEEGAAERAELSVTFVGDPAIVIPGASKNADFIATVEITETAGVGASINFIRLQLLRDRVEIERSEIGADFIEPDNRIDPSSTTRIEVQLGFNSELTDLEAIFTVSFTDDRGNLIERAIGFAISSSLQSG